MLVFDYIPCLQYNHKLLSNEQPLKMMACQFYLQGHQRAERPIKEKQKIKIYFIFFLSEYQDLHNGTHTCTFLGCLLGEYMNREHSKQKLLNIVLVYPVFNERNFRPMIS